MTQPYPYYTTKISVQKTQGEIIGLLYDHGAEGTQWTNLRRPGESERWELQFVYPVGEGTDRRYLAFRVRPPMMKRKDGTPHPEASMRLCFWWLKSKLEAVRYGLTTIEEEFMPAILAKLPTGEQATVGEIFLPEIRTGRAIEAGGLAKQLPSGKEDE